MTKHGSGIVPVKHAVDASDYVYVSEAMIEAGLESLRDLLRDADLRYLVESI